MSTKPVLYYTPRSPPCRAVLLTAAALKIDLDFRFVNIKAGEHLTPEFLKLNPQHTIPVLDDNGTVVTDSHVICAYLADKYAAASDDADDSLYPKNPEQRRLVQARLFFDCGHLFPRVRFIVEPIIYFGASKIQPEHITYMQRAYDGLERCLANGDYLCGAKLTIADLCTIASLSTAAAFAPIDAEQLPKLTRWFERMQSLEYYQKHNQEGLDVLVKFVNDTLAERQQAAAAKTESA